MTDCPSCGRYVGPYSACPHCGAVLGSRTSVRVLKLAALILAFGGLAFLWLVATQTDVSTIEIGQANAMLNLGYVRINGTVARTPSFDVETDFLGFWVRDDTGELYVAVYRDETRELIGRGHIPALGDRVSVAGTLRVREDRISMTLNLPEHLEIHRAAPVARQIANITAADEYKRVQVRGQVRGIWVPYPGLTLIELRDSSGVIELAISEVITASGQSLPAVELGCTADVTGTVSLYRDAPQLSLAQASDLTMLETPLAIAPGLTISQLDRAKVGRWIALEGYLTDISPFSAGVKYTLDDGTGRITMLLWRDLLDQMTPPQALGIGAMVRAQGQLADYNGEMEIVPQLPFDIQVLVPAAEDAATNGESTAVGTQTLTIGDLAKRRLGEIVSLRASVQDVASFAKGLEFTLDDGTGQIILLTWLNTYDNIAGREGLRPGAEVLVTGEISLFEGELQIVPTRGADIILLEPGHRPALVREIGSLGDGDLGDWVLIEGHIARVETFSSGLRVYLDDGSGEIMLLLWDNLLQRIPDSTDLPSAGSQLRIIGKVEEYEGTLQIVPVLPYDLEVSQ